VSLQQKAVLTVSARGLAIELLLAKFHFKGGVMAAKFVRIGILFIATLLVGNACSRKACTPGQPAPRPKWQATSPDGVSLTIELKATTFKVLDRIDATVTIRNGSDDLVAFYWDPLYMMVTYEFNDVQRNCKLEKTYWGKLIHYSGDMRVRGRQLQAGEELVFRENWNIQYDLTCVGKVRGKALFKYALPPRDSQKRFGEVEVDGIEFRFEDVDIPLFELIKAPPDRSRQPQ